MSMKGSLAALTIMAAINTMADNSNGLTPDDIDTTPKEPIIPKGCAKYFFNKDGCNKYNG